MGKKRNTVMYHIIFILIKIVSLRASWTDWWLTAEGRSYSFLHLSASSFLHSAPSPPFLFLLAAQLVLPEHLSSLTRRLIVHRREGWFAVHTETSGRSTFHSLLWPDVPSLHICPGMFALFHWWDQFTWHPACAECKQKLLSLFCLHCILIFPNIITFLQ